ncbi:MAG: hypothetical protein ACKOYJ_09190, partial [Planctomycetia bacterium]
RTFRHQPKMTSRWPRADREGANDSSLDTKDIERFAFDSHADARADVSGKYGFAGELLDLFVQNSGAVVHKWHHYIPLYDRYFARFRGTSLRFLEIGVSKGGSLQMWRKYFGDSAVIFGIDIDPLCRQYDGKFGSVRIGSQVDTSFLDEVVREMGGVDVVLDDGSHHMDHIPVTLRHLFPLLSFRGIYMIENLHTAYWRQWGGGFGVEKNFFRYTGDIVDNMHRWYHDDAPRCAAFADTCSGVHIHDSIVVLEKDAVHRPTHSRHG